MTMIADEKVFLQLPLKTEAKVVISGMYITEIKSVRGGIPPMPEKKKFSTASKRTRPRQRKVNPQESEFQQILNPVGLFHY